MGENATISSDHWPGAGDIGGLAVTGPRFTVIVPTHDRPELLAEALASVEAQTVSDFECLVIDDASDPPAVIPSDPRFRLIPLSANRGPSAARNAGLDAAVGEVVTFLDDDDLWTPVRLALAEEGLYRAPVTVCGKLNLDDPEGPVVCGPDGEVADTILDSYTPQVGATAVRREVVPHFDEAFDNLEDVDWWVRLAAVAPVASVTGVGLLYRRHSGPRDRTGGPQRLLDNQRYLALHADWFASHRRAAAFRWWRVGDIAMEVGEPRVARRAFWRSLWLRPSLQAAGALRRSVLARA